MQFNFQMHEKNSRYLVFQIMLQESSLIKSYLPGSISQIGAGNLGHEW